MLVAPRTPRAAIGATGPATPTGSEGRAPLVRRRTARLSRSVRC